MNQRRSSTRNQNASPTNLIRLVTVLLMLGLLFTSIGTVQAQSSLSVEIIAGYNLVVDSNVTATSTYSPAAATIVGRVCNDGTTALTGVQAYIGDYGSLAAGTYPSTDSAGFAASHPLYNTGTYAFRHMGGRIGLTDATRYVGDLAVGECRVQYWHFSYPRCENTWDGSQWAWSEPPCSGSPTWGDSVKPDDDLALSLDVWVTADGGTTANASRTMTMRNEISAMANKIQPNPDGRWFNTNSDQVLPGDTITSNGILYSLGNVRFGFDNDNNYVPDYNAWLQPIGDPAYDPSCFRLIGTSGVLTVTRGGGNPDLLIYFDDQNDPPSNPSQYGGPLYFTNLPSDNTNVRGKVYYTFLALDGPCSTGLTPYQEVASGYDNEKFNGDYGAGLPPLGSLEPAVTIDKSSSPNSVSLGTTWTYNVPLYNGGAAGAGLPLSTGGIPLVVSDTVPAGLEYIGGSASADLGTTIRFSTDSGQTWSSTDPGNYVSTAPNGLLIIQWWLDDTLDPGAGGTTTFQVRAPAGPTPPTYSGDPIVENCADSRFGNNPAFAEACAITLIQGNNSVGDLVWRDDDNDGIYDPGDGEVGLDGVAVSLYWDKNGDGLLDDGDVLISTMDTYNNGSAGYYTFSNLPDGNYLVQVDTGDADIPQGHRLTTLEVFAVDLDSGSATLTPVNYLDADFGFGPALTLDKQLVSGNPAYEMEYVTYTIDVTNNRPGDGSGQEQACTYTAWGSTLVTEAEGYSGSGNKAWPNAANIALPGEPEGSETYAPYANAAERIAVKTFDAGMTTGAPQTVEILVDLRVVQGTTAFTNETMDFSVVDCVDGVCEGSNQGHPGGNDAWVVTEGIFTPLVTSLPADGIYVLNVTSYRNWTWDDLSSGNIVVRLETGGSGPNVGEVYVDAIAFRVTTGLTCNQPADTISPLPLTDTFEDAKMTFVSASPAESSVAGGTITWDDVGPLYPGQTKTVTVTLKVKDGVAPTTHLNCAASTGATFVDGQFVNDAQDCVTHDLAPAGTIGDTVWNDNGGPSGSGTAGNGVQDGDEQGIPGVTVYLYLDVDGNGLYTPGTDTLVDTQVTNATDPAHPIGWYLFEAVHDGNYVTMVDTSTLPGSTFTQTGDPDESSPPACVTCDSQGATTLNNNDADPTNDDDLTQDYGYLVPNTIYGNVWEDNDGDGLWETGENGFPGVTVYLDDCGVNGICGDGDDGPSVSTTTGPDGDYLFSDLPDGNYRVRVDTTTLPPGATWTNTADPEGDMNSQSNVIPAAGGNIYGPYDFGYHRSGSLALGDTVYVDWNGDGDQDTGEEGIPGVTVYLYQDDNGDGVIDPDTDGLIASTTTDADGIYGFGSLAPQSYIVVVDEGTLGGSYGQTQDPDEDPGVCTTCDGQGGSTLVAADDLTVDFGYQPLGSGSIGDYVWQDDDGDGVQDAGESGIANITVNLYEDSNGDGIYDPADDALIATTTTDANGNYLFTGLPAGDYLVDVDTTDGDLPTDGYGQPYVLSTDNDPHPVTLTTGQEYLDADFGFTAGGTIGDYVWQDDNGDGQQDFAEPPISGVTVNLYVDVDGDGVYSAGDTLYASDVTDVNGLYLFTSLPADDYVVVVDTGTLPAGFVQTGDPDLLTPCSGGTCDSQSGVSLAPGQIDLSRDFGYLPPGRIGDTLWIDVDGNGVRDAGEAGIPYITVELDNGACIVGLNCPTTETDSDGYYYFGNLSDGDYTVIVHDYNYATPDPDWPTGLVLTYDPDEANPCATCDSTGSTTLSPGNREDLTRDFGYQYNGAYNISGYVFYDWANDGGLYDDTLGDIPYTGVTVFLWNSDGLLIGTTTTDSLGYYLFDNLPPGDYTVSVNRYDTVLGDVYPTEPAPDPYRTPVSIVDAPIVHQDFGFYSPPPPTSVSLLSFGAQPQEIDILLAWETDNELDNVGFNLYRAESPDGPRTQLNGSLIPSQAPGGSLGGTYAFLDSNVQAGITYYYWLEAINLSNFPSRFGPVDAQLTPATTPTFNFFLPLVNK